MKKILLLNLCIVSLMAAEFGCGEEIEKAYERTKRDIVARGFSYVEAGHIISALGDFSQYKTETAAKIGIGDAVFAVRDMLDPKTVQQFFDGNPQFQKMRSLAQIEKTKDRMREKLAERKAARAAKQVAQVGNSSKEKSVKQIMAELGLNDDKPGKSQDRKAQDKKK